MKRFLLLFTIALASLSYTRPAQAQVSEADVEAVTAVLQQMASENLRRLRRGVAFGPRLSAAGLYGPKMSPPFDAQIGVGLALYTFAVPFTFEVQQVVVERVRARLISHARSLVDQGKTPSRDDLLSEGRNIFQQVLDEVIGQHQRRDRTLEKPRFGLSLEGAYQPGAGAGLLRLTPTVPLAPLSLGLTLAAHFASNPTMFVGGEASVRITPADGPRPTVYEPFTRFEVPTFQRDLYGWQWTFGVRALLDVI